MPREVELDADEQYPVNRRQILNDLAEESRLLRLALKLPTESGEYQWELLEPNLLLAHVVGSQPGYEIANQARCTIGVLGKGDIIFRGDDAGMAQCFFQERSSGSLFVCVARCESLGAVTPHSVRLRVTPRLEAWPVENTFLANAWYPHGADLVVIL